MGRTVSAFEDEGEGNSGILQKTGEFTEVFRSEFHATERIIPEAVLTGGYDQEVRVEIADSRKEIAGKYAAVIINP